MKNLAFLLFLPFLLASCKERGINDTGNILPVNMFEYSGNIEPRWSSFENINAEKGMGGMENNGAKGHACDSISAGATKTLLNVSGTGIINRIWITISDRSPLMLRSLVLRMYWDGQQKPAVSVPFGDFFGIGLGKTAAFENDLFANPEGRSFNCFIKMPFKTAARIEVVNESGTDLPMIFFDIDFQLLKKWDENFMYFHSYWHRDTATVLAQDFEIMPAVSGKGRFLGSNIGINANPAYGDCWWGEGEVKMYLDGDDKYPTLVGSGTEDYIGTAWGQGLFHTRTTGCLVADSKNLQWAYYRYHIPDPVYFKTDCRVTIQQIGGNSREIVSGLLKKGVNLIPVTVHDAPRMIHIYEKGRIADLEDPSLPDAWTNFYRSDDISATCYFYLDTPADDLPDIQPVSLRTWKLASDL
jgi:hypothetical protein